MRIVAVVPMKLNNRRLPQKNTRRFSDGRPLCDVILSTLLDIATIDDVYVYCSDNHIQKCIPKEVRFLQRSNNLDKDSTTMNDVLLSFLNDVDADIYVLAHATAPFVSKETIENGIRAVVSDNYDSAFAVKKLQDFLWKNGEPINYDLNNIPRTQDLEPLFVETCGLYIYKKNVLSGLKRRIGINPFLIEVGEIESIDIDEMEDFEIANSVYCNLFLKDKKIGQNSQMTLDE